MMSRRRLLKSDFRLETLEGRIALSGAAHSLHAVATAHAAPVHVAQASGSTHKAPAIPNPVIVNLTPQNTGTVVTDASYDARVHLITIKGTITSGFQSIPPGYPYYYMPYFPTNEYFSVNVNQAVDRFRSVTGSQSSFATVADASVKTIPFTEKIVASAGQFESGTAQISVIVDNYYQYTTASFIVRLRNAKAY